MTHGSRLKLAGHLVGAIDVIRENGIIQSEDAVVGQLNGVFFVIRGDDG